jgi:hypothetical protein
MIDRRGGQRLLSIVWLKRGSRREPVRDQLPPHRRKGATLLIVAGGDIGEAAVLEDPGMWNEIAVLPLASQHWADGTFVGARLTAAVSQLEHERPFDLIAVSNAASESEAFVAATRVAFDLDRPFVAMVDHLDLETLPARALRTSEPTRMDLGRGSVVAFSRPPTGAIRLDLRDSDAKRKQRELA